MPEVVAFDDLSTGSERNLDGVDARLVVGSILDRPAIDAAVGEADVVVDLTAVELMAADAVVLLTDHDDFDYALVEEHAQYIFDTRNRCRGRVVERL